MMCKKTISRKNSLALALLLISFGLQVLFDTLHELQYSFQGSLCKWQDHRLAFCEPSRSQAPAPARQWLQVAQAQPYGHTTVEGSSPSVEAALQDDDDYDEEPELDASATGEIDDPEEGDADEEESYGDGDDNDRQEARRVDVWRLAPSGGDRLSEAESGRQLARLIKAKMIWSDLDDWRGPNRRDADDGHTIPPPRHKLKRRGLVAKTRSEGLGPQPSSLDNNKDEDFAIDDGDEDAWVHDGIDDIHIDPETRRAASELSRDTESANMDSEYEPNGQHQVDQTRPTETGNHNTDESDSDDKRNPVRNFERVISLSSTNDDDHSPNSRMAQAGTSNDWSTKIDSDIDQDAGGAPLPAALLTIDQIQQLINESAHPPVGRRQDGDDLDEEDDEDGRRKRRKLIVVMQ